MYMRRGSGDFWVGLGKLATALARGGRMVHQNRRQRMLEEEAIAALGGNCGECAERERELREQAQDFDLLDLGMD